ncbi:MAG: hypothetical protein IT210_08995 [Armatimonadetes bacterium]|nr:hypothetical protein [Armatimonadota bacterium]
MRFQPLQIGDMESQELQDILRRAQEIDLRRFQGAEMPGDAEALLRAAEAAGISREAVEQSLREHFGMPLEDIKPGERVFAKSADGAFYIADVLEVMENRARVRFLTGGDHALPLTDLRVFSILPGQKLQCYWAGWGWCTVRVERFDPEKGMVRVSDGLGYEKTLDLTLIRIRAEKSRSSRSLAVLITRTAIGSALFGGFLGAILIRLLS